MPAKLFFCYAHEDEPLLNELKHHLEALRRQGLIEIWCDRNISAGVEWGKEIDVHLNSAQIILLLISHYFIASDYCYSIEMKRAMERHEQGEARVIPIILRHVDFQGTPFSKLQALPTNAIPVKSKSWSDQDEAFYNVAEGIRKVVEQLKAPILLQTLTGHSNGVCSVAMHPHKRIIASGGGDSTIKLWNLDTGELLRTLIGHLGTGWSVAFRHN